MYMYIYSLPQPLTQQVRIAILRCAPKGRRRVEDQSSEIAIILLFLIILTTILASTPTRISF